MPTRTFEPTEATYQRIRDHIREYELTDQQKAYPRTKKRIQDVRDLYLIWMDLCDEYKESQPSHQPIAFESWNRSRKQFL